MLINKKKNILIVGLGLMGGSYARALKKQGFHVEAIDKKNESVDFAKKNAIIDDGFTEVDKAAVEKADIVVFALYPKVFLEWIEKYQQYFKSGVLITDVTGVKSNIVYDIQRSLRDDVEYVAAHPMAGREVYGVENSDERIFYGANYIVVPTNKNTPDAIETVKDIGRILGVGKISELSPEEHDEMIGFVSQLTHCIAVNLMTSNDNPDLVNYTGDSFRDLTRIARINENMWPELFVMNKKPLLEQMDSFINEFMSFRNMLENEDIEGMKDKMRLSTKRRALFDKK